MITLSCNDITVSYDDVVLSSVSFALEKGSFLCIVGENGSGKTTLIKALLGLVPLQSGSVVLDKHVSVGYVSQQTLQQKRFPASVLEIVLSGCRSSFPFYTKNDKKVAKHYMDLMQIGDMGKRSYSELSGGQQQRVRIARALCAQKGLLMLDEPVTGLDPLIARDLYTLLKQLQNMEDITILMVSHDIASALSYATHILHIDKTVCFFGTSDEYKNSAYGQRFLGGSEHA